MADRTSGSGWWATPSWARPTPRRGARPAGSSTCRCSPTWPCCAAATRRRRPRRREKLGWRSVETDWKALLDPRRRRAGRHLHARRHARRDRDRRAGRGQARAVREAAGQHRRRGARDGRRRRARRGPRACAAWSASATGGCRRWRWPGGWSSRAGSARSGTSARSTCRTGSSTRSSRWSGGCRRNAAGSGALGDIGAHIVDMAQYLTGDLLTGVSALTETFVRERPLPAASSGLAASGGTRAGHGRRRRRGAVPRPVRRRRGGVVRGHAVRHRPQERAAASSSTAAAARWRSTRSG